MSQIEDINFSFIKLEYFRNKLRKYLQFIFKIDLKIKAILLFGSVATGKARNDEDRLSDIDLIIICDDLPMDDRERRRLILDLTRPVTSGIQDLWWTSKEMEHQVDSKFYLILDALDEGKILYDPENFLQNLKVRLFKELKEKGVKKTRLYWQWPIEKFGDKIEF